MKDKDPNSREDGSLGDDVSSGSEPSSDSSMKKGIERNADIEEIKKIRNKIVSKENSHTKLWTALTLSVSFVILYVLLATSITPDKFDLKAGDIAPETITATKDIEDVITTQRDMQKAMDDVRAVMQEDAQANTDMMEKFNNSFALLREVRGLVSDTRLQLEAEGEDEESIKAAVATDEIMDQAEDMIGSILLQNRERQIEVVLSCSDKKWTDLEDASMRALLMAQDSAIKEGFEDSALKVAESDIRSSLIRQTSDLQSIGMDVLRGCIKANTFVNEEETQLQREQARDAVAPTIFKKGQNIVKAGDIITQAQYEVINNLGLLNTEVFDVLPYLGIGLVLLLLMYLTIVFCRTFMPEMIKQHELQMVLSIIVIIVVLSAIGVEQLNVFLIPVTLGVLLITILINYRLALVMNVVLAVLVSLVATRESVVLSASMFNSAISCIVSGTAGAYVIRRRQHRSQVLLAGIIIGVFNLLTMLALGLVSTASIMQMVQAASWSAGGGLLASMLCIGIQPVIETIFHIATPSKLLELSNPNQPLLKRLLVETPGTYHHSIIVANLAESAAEAIDANGLLARVGAYYHDIGKLKRPLYYKENQLGDNPHDRTDAAVSTAIITAHTTDGAEMARQAKLPKPIIDIILEHHGDTPVQYFYAKACEQAKENGKLHVDVMDFRYSGPKPNSKESAIIMLADTVEAASRCISDPTPKKISAMIKKLIKSKFDDGQLGDSTLMMSDLDKIHAAFAQSMNGVFHERIEYPTIDVGREDEVEFVLDQENGREQTGWLAQQMGMTSTVLKNTKEDE